MSSLRLALVSLALSIPACDGSSVAPGSESPEPVEPSWPTDTVAAIEPNADAPATAWAWPDETPAATATPRNAERASKATDDRRITFNGKPARARDLEILARYEKAWGVQVPSGDYWYDNTSGAAGQWGGPTRGFLGAGLELGGADLPANASGGGNGRTTGVFINGRELHALDVQGLGALLGQPVLQGDWWVDSQGNFGARGQAAVGNLLWIASARNKSAGGGGNSYYRSDIGTGSSTFVGSGCAAVHGRTSPSDSSSSYSYYVGCE